MILVGFHFCLDIGFESHRLIAKDDLFKLEQIPQVIALENTLCD